jgi:PEP-CTERM/exosortase A-associated glycosyltransferase
MRSSWEDAAVSNGTTTEGSARYRASRALETYALRRADAVVTICDGLRTDVIARGVPADRVTVVPNAVDTESFMVSDVATMLAAKSRLGLESNFVLGFIGSFFAWEGLSLLLEALPGILRQRPDVKLLLVGSGNEEQALRRKIAERGLGHNVIFTGRVPHGEVAKLYAAIDVLVYPRLPLRLTEMVTPLKPLEAMALGQLLVASDVGGHREMIRDRDTGMLFRAGDPASLAEAVLALAADPELQGRLRRNGPSYVQSERLWSIVVPRYEHAYSNLHAAA